MEIRWSVNICVCMNEWIGFLLPQINYQYYYYISFGSSAAAVVRETEWNWCCTVLRTYNSSSYCYFSLLLLLFLLKNISSIVSNLSRDFYWNVKCIVLFILFSFGLFFSFLFCFVYLNATALSSNWFVYFTCINVFTINTHILQQFSCHNLVSSTYISRCVRNCLCLWEIWNTRFVLIGVHSLVPCAKECDFVFFLHWNTLRIIHTIANLCQGWSSLFEN